MNEYLDPTGIYYDLRDCITFNCERGEVIVTRQSPTTRSDEMREALIDIAHDCGSLEAAQRRAKEGLQ